MSRSCSSVLHSREIRTPSQLPVNEMLLRHYEASFYAMTSHKLDRERRKSTLVAQDFESGDSQRKHQGEAGDPVPIAIRTNLDDQITGEDSDGGVTASSSIIVAGEDGLVT
ncbi:hypothetical protein TIFTF001_056743 [Ficus carica]|uniref:Uncharacterized protein n=1 Tax=Ficus carica TaxID=3494 RepID=A0AA88JJU1_FICCA|nr:hypothetical protein TIFTF001_056743 [Ficus carica]